MKRIFITLILILSIFSITNAYSEEMHKEYYDSGKILKESHFSNDKENGEEKIYYENGAIKEKRFYNNGKEEGKSLFYDEKGNIIKTEIYKNDVKQ